VTLVLAVLGAAVSAGVALFLGRHLNARTNHRTGYPYLAFAVFAAIPIILLITPLVSGTSFVLAGKTYGVGVDAELILNGVQTIVQSAQQNVTCSSQAEPASSLRVARSSIHAIRFTALGSLELAGTGFGGQPGTVTLRASGRDAPFNFSKGSIATWSDDRIQLQADGGDSKDLHQLLRELALASKAVERRVHVLEYTVTPLSAQATHVTQVAAMVFRVYGTAPICDPEADSCSQIGGFSEVGNCVDFRGMVECNNRCWTGAKIVCARFTSSDLSGGS
jgi:hypothetical protein